MSRTWPTSCEVVLGAVMFSNTFERNIGLVIFQTSPVPGYEQTGPNPRAGRRESILPMELACMLGNCAVMLVFIASSVNFGKRTSIVDSEERISAFIQEQLMNDTGFSRPAKRTREGTGK
jgi:hypothetical protein